MSFDMKSKLKQDWYQTDTHIIFTLFVKNISEKNFKINFKEKQISATVTLPDCTENLNLNLLHEINPVESTYKIYSTKIEIKLKKIFCYRWNHLEGSDNDESAQVISADNSQFTKAPSYPSSSRNKKDWDQIEQQVKKDEENEKPQDDAALNGLFQKIYGDGTDEVKMAMKKSFIESGGTVLSTNWDEVKEGKVEVKPPDGMEHKVWEK